MKPLLMASSLLIAVCVSRPGARAAATGTMLAHAVTAKSAAAVRPIRMKANESHINQAKRTIELIGNARIEDRGLIINAPKITVRFAKQNNDVEEARATGGNVRIESSTARVGTNAAQPILATCREAVYRGSTRQITMEGPVSINGKGQPDSKVLEFSAKAPKAVIDLTDEGTVIHFEGEHEIELLLPEDTGVGKSKGKAGDKPEKPGSEKKKEGEANG